MIRHGSRWGVGVACLVTLLSGAPAQEGKEAPAKGNPPPPPAPAKDEEPAPPPNDDYRQFFKKPETALDFWNALQFELEVGRPDLAANLLHGLVASKPADAALVDLADRVGMAAILRLRNVRNWSAEPKVDVQGTQDEIARLQKAGADPNRIYALQQDLKRAEKEAKVAATRGARADGDVETLVATVTAAVKRVRGDPKRIAALIGELSASPEENAYALKELYKSGALAVPALIDSLRAANGADRLPLLDALRRMSSDAVPPMVAALDSDDALLKTELLDVLRERLARQAVPNLWYLAASTNEPDVVRSKATEMLSSFLDTPASRLPAAKVALTKEAERYYRHAVTFPNPDAVTVWRWDNGHVVAGWPGTPTVPASAAEEYYGVHFADQALTLDPTYRPAQVVLLSLVLDKGTERAGLAQPLSKGAPKAYELLASASPELVTAVLERALGERHTPVVLNCVRTLGGLADPRAGRPSARGEPALVRSLYYPDRRVQMAAAEALLRGPGSVAPAAAGRVLEILRRALATEPAAADTPKVLVGIFNESVGARIGNAVRQGGFDAVPARTGREVMWRLGRAADVDLLLLDAALPDPGLAELLGQLAADTYAGQLPVVLLAPDERIDSLRRATASSPNVYVAPAAIALAPTELRGLLRSRLAESAGGPPLSAAEKQDYAERAVRHLDALARGEPAGVDVRPAGDAVLDALRGGRLSPEGQLAAVRAAAHLPGSRPQRELANVVLDGRRPLPVRVAATRELVRHSEQNSVLLTREQTGALEAVFARAETDPALKAELALLAGSFRPDARLTGERLLRYRPTPPASATPPPALKEDKGEPKDEGKEGKDEGK